MQIKRRYNDEPAVRTSPSSSANDRGHSSPTPRPMKEPQQAGPKTNGAAATLPPRPSSRNAAPPVFEGVRKKLVAEPSVPSLLNRLAIGDSLGAAPAPTIPAKRSAESETGPANKRQNTQSVRTSQNAALQRSASLAGFSIKGAASRAQRGPMEGTAAKLERSSSLLERLKNDTAAVVPERSHGRRRRGKT